MKLQRIIFALLLCAATLATAIAQVHSLGPAVGLNLSTISNTDNSKFKPGFNAGIIYNYSTVQHFGFGLGVLYSQEGVAVDYGNVNGYSRLDYLRIPMKLQYFAGTMEDNFRPKIYVGPSFGLLLGGKNKVALENGTVVSNINRDNYNNLDIGIMGGLGFNCRIAEAVWFNFDIAYTHGLLDISDTRKDSKNRNVNVDVGVAWGF